jgi:CheY-like chemotaxis protein
VARTVLVADDSPTHQRKANGILTGEGLEVVTVSNGVAAIKKLPTVKPLLVLADVSMPGKDGYEVCEFVKNSPNLSHVPVLLIISDLEPYDEQRAARVHADGTIKKPFVQEELVAVVTKLIARAEAALLQAELPPPITAPPPPVMVTEPVDVEPEISTKVEAPEFAALPEDVAFAAPEAAVAEPVPAAVELVVEEQVPPVPEVAPTGEAVAPPAEEAAPEIAPVPEEAPAPVEPVLIEEVPAVAPPPPPSAEATLVFRAPAEIAEPILSEELPAEAPVPEPAPPLPEPVPEAAVAEVPPIAATTLESFSLTEAGAGQIRFAAPEAEAPAEAVGEIPAPVPEAAPAPPPVAAVDANLICAIVHRVVLKMAPSALPPQVIEDMARQLAEEIIAELGSDASQTQ